MVLVAAVVVFSCAILSEPVHAASRGDDLQNFNVPEWVRGVFFSPADNGSTPASGGPVPDGYSDRQVNEKADFCKRIEKSTLHERFLMAVDRARRADRPWWFTYVGVFFDEKISCPVNEREYKEGATLHERLMRLTARFDSRRWLQMVFGDAVTTAIDSLYYVYSSGVTILLLPILVSWLIGRVVGWLQCVKDWTYSRFVTDNRWLRSKTVPAIVVEHSSHSEDPLIGPVSPGAAPQPDVSVLPSDPSVRESMESDASGGGLLSDAVTLPSDKPIRETVAATNGAVMTALQESSKTTSREPGLHGSPRTKSKTTASP
ncbi:hypothetical protein HPB50_017360 [Hyalomma asiaticum]|uniref:Uncharacterized protein n=1 Tax=Hyalomma asiaticum TaxID=266040 RepID=A0ACB7RJM3_HYAAI|nr:hypothetical protein HPB50_017360 [Hyalomma asiaticum]